MYAVFFHAHQRLDKMAWTYLAQLLGSGTSFPTYEQIVHFEGQNGPDATKLKKGTDQNQPWHFYNPYDPTDTELLEIIQDHYQTLVAALQAKNQIRAAFEAAWLAHALVDGLTPAHQYPYEEELARLRGGQPRHTRTTLTSRALVKGETRRDSIKRSIQLVGPKGLLMNHTTFEGGAYTLIRTMRLKKNDFPPKAAFAAVAAQGVPAYFAKKAYAVAELKEYERFMEFGWTPKLAREIRRQLVPEMVHMITLAWYQAAQEAGLAVKKPGV